jgi:HD-like signal output (HDOD) protein
MVSLFFWRKNKKAEPLAEPAAAGKPVELAVTTQAPVPVASLPVRRMVYALALGDQRAADPSASPDATQNQLLLTASQTVAQVGTEPRYTPQRPSLLPQLMDAVNDEEASLRALSRIVAQDPRLTGEMLKTANSAAYRVSSAPVESIERAAALLGTRGIRTIMSAVLLKPLATAGGRTGRFGEIAWEHSIYSASAADAWAARNQDADPFAAQMLALLHGLGVVTVYRVLSDIYAANPGLPRDAAAMATALDTSATMAAGRIAVNWGLSERSRQALEAQSAAAPVTDSSPLARALQFGLYAGGLALLCRHGKLTEEESEAQITAGEFQGPLATRVWERLVRAYVRP